MTLAMVEGKIRVTPFLKVQSSEIPVCFRSTTICFYNLDLEDRIGFDICTWYLKDFLCFLSPSLIFVRLSVRYHVLLEHLVSQHLTGLLKLISVSSGG